MGNCFPVAVIYDTLSELVENIGSRLSKNDFEGKWVYREYTNLEKGTYVLHNTEFEYDQFITLVKKNIIPGFRVKIISTENDNEIFVLKFSVAFEVPIEKGILLTNGFI